MRANEPAIRIEEVQTKVRASVERARELVSEARLILRERNATNPTDARR